jgi:hypothetical protein
MAIELWEYAMPLAILPKPGIMDKGNHPKMAQHVRLVKYHSLPRIMCLIHIQLSKNVSYHMS